MKKLKIDKTICIPLYRQIIEDMKKKINSGILREDDYLPSEFKLMEEYGVSRTTVRQAIEILVREGYLRIKRGIGTIITKPKKNYYNLSKLESFNEVPLKEGIVGISKLINFSVIKPNARLADIFGENEKEFYKLENLRYIDKAPVEFIKTYIPKSVAPDLEKFDFSKNDLYKILFEYYGIKVYYLEKKFTAVNAVSEDAKILKISQGEAIQLIKTTVFNIEHKPVSFFISKNKGLISKLKILLVREEAE